MAGNSIAKANGNASAVPVRQSGGGSTGAGHLTLRSPREELTHISQLMDDFARRAFGYSPGMGLFGSNWMEPFRGGLGGLMEPFEDQPQVDIYEKDDTYQLFVSLPGYTPEQIHVETTGDSFVIHGERQALQQDEKASARQKSGVSSESRFRIEASLPGEIEPNKAVANFTNGVLEITMPKREASKPNAVQVPIQTQSRTSEKKTS